MLEGATRLVELDEAWGERRQGARLRAIRRGASLLHEKLAAGPHCVAVRTLPLTTLAYPTRHAFWGAALTALPFVLLTHRCVLVQFLQRGELKTLLFNPTDVDAARATPYFARLVEQLGERIAGLVARRSPPLETQLAEHGIAPEDVDYVAFDHFHTQDLRGLLGTSSRRPRFPNARLLAPRIEWDDWDDLHPLQRAWFVADGKEDVRTDAVVLTDGDLALGDGVMLVRTPGHTSGNQTLFLATSDGIWGISENGTCADAWSPVASRIRGLASFAKKHDVEVILNANTPELGADQYTSMMLERTIVDRVRRAPAFVQMFPSSEVTPSPLAPGLAPTIVFGAIRHGEIARPSRRFEASA